LAGNFALRQTVDFPKQWSDARAALKAISVRICKKRRADSIKKLPPTHLQGKSLALLFASLQLSIKA